MPKKRARLTAKALFRRPTNFQETCFIYPPSLFEVLDNDEYPIYQRLLTTSQEDIWDELAEQEGQIVKGAPSPIQYLCSLAGRSKKIMHTLEAAIKFFTHEPAIIRPESNLIIFANSAQDATDLTKIRYLDADNFFDFQNTLRTVLGEEEVEAPNEDEHPKIALIKAKGRKRDRLIQKGKSSGSISFSTMLVALSCMNVGFELLPKYGEISYPALFELFSMGQEKEKHDTDLQFIVGGADAKKINPKPWIRD